MCLYVRPIHEVSGAALGSFVIEIHFLKIKRGKNKIRERGGKRKRLEKEISEFG